MPTPILATKLYIPPHQPRAVLRPRLVERLNEGAHRRLILVPAPAGLGKTPPLSAPRPRRVERLSEGAHRRLILVSAPAGFGKTTLLSEWVAGCGRPAAWLSLDEGDNDPARFLAYLVTALRTVAADIGEGVLGILRSPRPPPTESILTALLNEIVTVPDDLVLVLDDYHVVDARPIDDVLAFLLEHLPPRMHLVIATREDPPLPPARVRGSGQVAGPRA